MSGPADGALRGGVRALTEAAGLVEGDDRRLLRVWGPSALRMLNGLVTQRTRPLLEGRAAYAFFLTSKGRPVADARLLPGPEPEREAWLDVPGVAADSLLEHLRRFLPPMHARFTAVDEAARLSVVGPGAPAAVERAGGALGWPAGAPRPGELAPLQVAALSDATPPFLACVREAAEGPGIDLYVARAALPAARRALAEAVTEEGGGEVGPEAYDVWRVERGIPLYGRDITEANLPQETGQQDRAISFDKGCYTGQEVVARIHYRGHVNRRLVGFRFPGGEEPSEGAELYREGRRVGRVTSVARSPRLGPIGLGYARREVDPGERLAGRPEGEPWARVVELPFTDT